MKNILNQELFNHIKSFEKVDTEQICSLAQDVILRLKNGGKILIFGNGGSAADAQHFAAELTGRYQKERRALAAIALSTDTSAITAIGNDYGFEQIFARQINALCTKDDLCIGISTSGNSENVLNAFSQAEKIGAASWLLTSQKCSQNIAGVKMLKAPSSETARIQELHIFYIHCICKLVDESF